MGLEEELTPCLRPIGWRGNGLENDMADYAAEGTGQSQDPKPNAHAYTWKPPDSDNPGGCRVAPSRSPPAHTPAGLGPDLELACEPLKGLPRLRVGFDKLPQMMSK